MEKKYKCIGLLARQHGLAVLNELTKNNSNFHFTSIFTHKFNPKIYDPECNIRDDFADYQKLTQIHNIPLFTIDSVNEKSKLEKFVKNNEFDFLISVSWRYLISPQVFEKAKIGSFNIHRGDLPKYAGVEPIKRALNNNETKIAVTSHKISKDIDQGQILSKIYHNVNFDQNNSLEKNVERLKKEITPYFVELNMQSLEKLLEEFNDK